MKWPQPTGRFTVTAKYRIACWISLFGSAACLIPSAHAWGPHSEITQAALEVLGPEDALILRLGAQAPRLTAYCWMGDYFGVIMETPDELFYADDYLLFPRLPRYVDHTGPEVAQAIRPVFRRAVQALQTENAANAARWTGALLHFVQDAVCPPHAAGLRGTVHSHMESWVETNRIRIPDHAPVLLGDTEAQAFAGLQRRLDELVPQAEERGRRLRVAVEIGNRTVVRPVILQSALECARLTADLLHTLGRLGQAAGTGTAALQGRVAGTPGAGMERFPAKVVLADSGFSTLADLAGNFAFGNLPAGDYAVTAIRPGHDLVRAAVHLRPQTTNRCDLTLPDAPTNLVVNGDFHLSWTRPPAPDYWYATKSGWEGQPILLRDGQRYRLTAHFQPGSSAAVLVRWTRPYEHAVPRYLIEPQFERRVLTVADPEMEFTAGPKFGLLHLTLRGRSAPTSGLQRITLAPVPESN